MCDYSLMGIANRPATIGEELVLYKFPTSTKGFASPSEVKKCSQTAAEKRGFWERMKRLFRGPNPDEVTAVCIMPGTRLILHDIPPELQRYLNVDPVEEVTFTQITAEANVHRDAVRFFDGTEVSLQRLTEGQRARILSFDSGSEGVPVRPDDVMLHQG